MSYFSFFECFANLSIDPGNPRFFDQFGFKFAHRYTRKLAEHFQKHCNNCIVVYVHDLFRHFTFYSHLHRQSVLGCVLNEPVVCHQHPAGQVSHLSAFNLRGLVHLAHGIQQLAEPVL